MYSGHDIHVSVNERGLCEVREMLNLEGYILYQIYKYILSPVFAYSARWAQKLRERQSSQLGRA